MRVSEKANLASFMPIDTSQQQASPRPPAMAAPSIRATVTWGRALRSASTSPTRVLVRMACSRAPEAMALKLFRSPPAQKNSPRPRKVTPRMARSFSTAAQMVSRSSTTSSVSGFLRSGWLNQTVSQPSSSSSCTDRVLGKTVINALPLHSGWDHHCYRRRCGCLLGYERSHACATLSI